MARPCSPKHAAPVKSLPMRLYIWSANLRRNSSMRGRIGYMTMTKRDKGKWRTGADPGSDPLIRSQVLYPAELPVRRSGFYWLTCLNARGDCNLPAKAIAIGSRVAQTCRLKNPARHGAAHTISRQCAQFSERQRPALHPLQPIFQPPWRGQKSYRRQTAYARHEWRAPSRPAP